jgi:hypothetical protein
MFVTYNLYRVHLLFIIKRKVAISFVCLFNLLGQSMPMTTVQDANSIRGISRCTRYKLYVTNICKQLVVDDLFKHTMFFFAFYASYFPCDEQNSKSNDFRYNVLL